MEAGKELHLSSRGMEQKARTFEKLPSRLSLVLFLQAGVIGLDENTFICEAISLALNMRLKTEQGNGLVFGMLYPAYYSYKAVKTKNVKEY
ncbi:hypothetical protein STEG23_014107, partial [Scotinomys teguina]